MQFELVDDDLSEVVQQGAVFLGELTRCRVDHAEGSHIETLFRAQGDAGIEADVGRSGHQRILGKARILCGVGHHQDRRVADRVSAEGEFARRLVGIQADL